MSIAIQKFTHSGK